MSSLMRSSDVGGYLIVTKVLLGYLFCHRLRSRRIITMMMDFQRSDEKSSKFSRSRGRKRGGELKGALVCKDRVDKGGGRAYRLLRL
jgi:hypothetical protein